MSWVTRTTYLPPKRSFFKDAERLYGRPTVEDMKKYSRLQEKATKAKNRQIFLLKCRQHELQPVFLSFNVKHIKFDSGYLDGEFKKMLTYFKRKTLNLLIKETYTNLRQIDNNIRQIDHILTNRLDTTYYETFKKHESLKTKKLFNNIKKKNIDKINKLRCTPKNTKQNHISEKWIENQTNIQLPENVKEMLSLGYNYALPITTEKDLPIDDIVASIELAIENLPTTTANDIRHKVTKTIQKQNKPNKANFKQTFQ